ncbi:peptidoglycan-binding protein [Massilia sp. W12]|uniref:peptidoglycan-binding protein n=1 Tax=Massilia sp. W12 TaxID=3126507 RepID=UPI0030CE35D4
MHSAFEFEDETQEAFEAEGEYAARGWGGYAGYGGGSGALRPRRSRAGGAGGAASSGFQAGYQAGLRAAMKQLRGSAARTQGGRSGGARGTKIGMSYSAYQNMARRQAQGTGQPSRTLWAQARAQQAQAGAQNAQGATRGGSPYVRAVQSKLNHLFGLKLPTSGVLDVQARSTLRRFQRLNGLPVSGLLDKNTRRMLQQANSSKPYRQAQPQTPRSTPGQRQGQNGMPPKRRVTVRGLPRPRPRSNYWIDSQRTQYWPPPGFNQEPGANPFAAAEPAPAQAANPFDATPAPAPDTGMRGNVFAQCPDGALGGVNPADANPFGASSAAPDAAPGGDLNQAQANPNPFGGDDAAAKPCTCKHAQAAADSADAPAPDAGTDSAPAAGGGEGEIPQAIYRMLQMDKDGGNFAQYDSFKAGGRRAAVPIQDIVKNMQLNNKPAAYLITFEHQGKRMAYSGCTNNLRRRMVEHLHKLSFPVGLQRQYMVYYTITPDVDTASRLEKNLNAQRGNLRGTLVNLRTELEAELFA